MFNIIFLGVALIAATSLASIHQQSLDNNCFQKCIQGRREYCNSDNKYECKQQSISSVYNDCIKHCSEEASSHYNKKEIKNSSNRFLENNLTGSETSFMENKTTYGNRTDKTPTHSYHSMYRSMEGNNTTTSDVSTVTLEKSKLPVNKNFANYYETEVHDLQPEQVSAAIGQDAQHFMQNNFQQEFDDFKPIEEYQENPSRATSEAERWGR